MKTENEKLLNVSACAEFTKRPADLNGRHRICLILENSAGAGGDTCTADNRACRLNISKLEQFQKCHI